ncbi:hypothetical protein CASFOL_007958 [Castilleja foliolosa]|uniref:NADH:quinone oxidoreductase/Mrp antiporter transmembrane domain-containing protein n=1 Tax=Castilleja foliolosa TaxID=1961234 RepID=A0ABD3E628_9LAMI
MNTKLFLEFKKKMIDKSIYNNSRKQEIINKKIMNLISLIGIITVLLGATLALAQKDIKKGLAYSTMSQLGYMMLALGMGSYRSALFHLITHAYSKALLFLGSGSVIHSMETIEFFEFDFISFL